MQKESEGLAASQRSHTPSVVLAIAVLALLGASYVVNAADRQVFPVLLSDINKDYGFSLAQGGFLATIFTLGIGIGGLPTGFLLDRLSRKTVMLIGIVIYSGFTLLTAVSFGFPDMATYRTLSGIGEAMQNAALFSAVGSYFYARRSLALGVLNVSYGLGSFLGPLVGANLLVSTGDWRVPFYVFGVVGFVFVVVILLLVRKIFTEKVGGEQGGGDRAGTTRAAATSTMPTSLLNRDTCLIALATAAGGLSLYSYLGLYPSFLQDELGFTPGQAGLAASMFGIGSLVASIPAGYLGDLLGNRWVVFGSFVCAMATGVLLFMVAQTPLQQTALSFLEGAFGSGFVYVNLYSLIQRSMHPKSVGRASGLFVGIFYLPSALAGYLFATLVTSYGWGWAAAVQLVCIPAVGLGALLALGRTQLHSAIATHS